MHNKMVKIKIDFYQGSDSVVQFFKEYKQYENKFPPQVYEDYIIKIRDLSNNNNIVSGIINKYRNDNLPKKGKPKADKEMDIPLDEDEYLIEKTHFLFKLDNKVLAYQMHQVGTAIGVFAKYLSCLNRESNIEFNPIMEEKFYKMLNDDSVRMKKFNIKIARPTNIHSIKKDSKNLWRNRILDFITETGAMELTIAAQAASRGENIEKKILAEAAKEFLRSHTEYCKEKPSQSKVEFIDADNIPHVVDLFGDRVRTTIEISGEGRYPIKEKVFEAIKQELNKFKKKINNILGKSE